MCGRGQHNIVKQFSSNKTKEKQTGQWKKKKPSQVRVFLKAPSGKRPDDHLSELPLAKGHQAKGTLRAGKWDDSALYSNSPIPLSPIIKPEVGGSDIGTRDRKTKKLKC